jgi:TolB protein
VTTASYTSAQLRIHHLTTGEDRLVLESSTQIFEAPNWTPDGQTLIVNCDGRLHTVATSGGVLEPIESGHLVDLNNDHILSPDGSVLYVSSRDGHLYGLPATGGEPWRITNDRGPDFQHYLHGISPDGATLAYVGVEPYQGVRGAYRNIFTIPAGGGADTQLTDTPAATDGPEYFPDGRWIYLNREVGGAGEGHAQIFRMRPDGAELTQLTSDERVNWFPHPSPNGELILFLSFPPGTRGHPADRDIILRTMTPDGADVTDVVALRGGQGTLNVNSWAPDSEQFAYVAYPKA